MRSASSCVAALFQRLRVVAMTLRDEMLKRKPALEGGPAQQDGNQQESGQHALAEGNAQHHPRASQSREKGTAAVRLKRGAKAEFRPPASRSGDRIVSNRPIDEVRDVLEKASTSVGYVACRRRATG